MHNRDILKPDYERYEYHYGSLTPKVGHKIYCEIAGVFHVAIITNILPGEKEPLITYKTLEIGNNPNLPQIGSYENKSMHVIMHYYSMMYMINYNKIWNSINV